MTTSTTPNFDPGKLQTITVVIPTDADGLLKATRNGAGYAVVPYDFEIDHIELAQVLSGDINTDGSGNFEVIAYENGVALWAANLMQISYAAAHNYVTADRADLLVTSLTKGRELRVDITEVFAGAATSYTQEAVLKIHGVAK